MGPAGLQSHFSYSQYNTLTSCGKMYEYSYVKGIKVPPGWALIRGSAVHKSREQSFKQKLETGSPMLEEEVVQITSDVVDKSFESEVKTDEGDTKEAAKGKAKDSAITLARLDNSTFQQEITPIALEQRVKINISGISLPILSFIDLVAEGPGGGVDIRDAKTAKKTPSFTDEELKRNPQTITYAIAEEARTGQAPEGVVLDYLVDLKTPKTKEFRTTPNEEDKNRVIENYARAVDLIEKGVFAPNPGHWKCSKMFCGYWRMCPFWSGR